MSYKHTWMKAYLEKRKKKIKKERKKEWKAICHIFKHPPIGNIFLIFNIFLYGKTSIINKKQTYLRYLFP